MGPRMVSLLWGTFGAFLKGSEKRSKKPDFSMGGPQNLPRKNLQDSGLILWFQLPYFENAAAYSTESVLLGLKLLT